LTAGTKHLVLGIFWQVVRYGILKEVSELAGSVLHLDPALPPEQILLLWLNHHLKASGVTDRVVTNFGEDLADGVVLTHVMYHVASSEGCDRSALTVEDKLDRAEIVLQNADKIGCRKFVGAKDIVEGNSRLLLAFVAGLFSKYPDMGPSQEAQEWKQKYLELRSLLDSQTQEWTSKESTLKQTLESIIKEKEHLLVDNEGLTKTHQDLKQQLQVSESDTSHVQKQLDQVEGSLTQVTTLKDDTSIKLDESEKENKELSDILDESLQKEAKQRSENAQLQQELEQIQQSNTNMSNENENMRLQLQNSLEQITQLQQAKATLEEEKEKISKAKQKLNKEKKSPH